MDAHAGHYFTVTCHMNDGIKDVDVGRVGAHISHDRCKVEPLWVHVKRPILVWNQEQYQLCN